MKRVHGLVLAFFLCCTSSAYARNACTDRAKALSQGYPWYSSLGCRKQIGGSYYCEYPTRKGTIYFQLVPNGQTCSYVYLGPV